jgi:hypothetical protein
MKTYADALLAICPDKSWAAQGDSFVWNDETDPPTNEDIVQKIAELEYIEEVEEYKRMRELAYPSTGEQFDKIFHDGVDAWKAEIQTIKDAHPKAEIDSDILEERKNQALFDYQLSEYSKAANRLEKYRVDVGKPAVTEEVVIGKEQVWSVDGEDPSSTEATGEWILVDVSESKIVEAAIDPLEETITSYEYVADSDGGYNRIETEIRNPEIVKDEEERAAAQAIVDGTPQEVIDHYNSL